MHRYAGCRTCPAILWSLCVSICLQLPSLTPTLVYKQDVVYIKTPNTITLDAGRNFRKIQIITRLYASTADVLNTFDVDCCAFGFDGVCGCVLEMPAGLAVCYAHMRFQALKCKKLLKCM